MANGEHKRLTGSARGALALRWALALAAGGVLWWDPSSGLATGILYVAGLAALACWRTTAAGGRNPAGAVFGLGALWALASWAWSVDPSGTARDLIKTAPLVFGVWAVPAFFDRPGRIWAALLASAGFVSLRLALDLARVAAALGWPEVLAEARFFKPYLYTHPNVSSMLAGLCVLVFAVRFVVGAPGLARKGLLGIGVAVNLAYLVVMASRGPQAAFALAALALPVAWMPGWRSRWAAVLLAGAAGWALWQVAGQVNPRFRDKTMADFNQRDKIWDHARALLDERPNLGYGFGKKAFQKAVYGNPERPPPRTRIHYPHSHSYWLMTYFQGGRVAFGLCVLAWAALLVRLWRFMAAAAPGAGFLVRLRARALPLLLLACAACVLVYGVADYPDNAIRNAQFYLVGLAMALTRPPAAREADA